GDGLIVVLDDGHQVQALAAHQRKQLAFQRARVQVAHEQEKDIQTTLTHRGRSRQLGKMLDRAAGRLQLLQQQRMAVIVPTAYYTDGWRARVSGCRSLVEVMHIPNPGKSRCRNV